MSGGCPVSVPRQMKTQSQAQFFDLQKNAPDDLQKNASINFCTPDDLQKNASINFCTPDDLQKNASINFCTPDDLQKNASLNFCTPESSAKGKAGFLLRMRHCSACSVRDPVLEKPVVLSDDQFLANFSSNFRLTTGGTMSLISPPKRDASFIMDELVNIHRKLVIRKTV